MQNKKITKKMKLLFFASVFVFSGFINQAFALPAFPGAEGFGTETIGGRGGTVIKVTNLNNSGDGSLRAALTASGARIIVFDVSGTIHLDSIVTVTNPYMTIAGQTSPGGISVSGGTLRINTHDVIITHMRFRLGSDVCDNGTQQAGTNCDQAGDPVQIAGISPNAAYNVVIDHCSFTWGCDETLDISSWYADTYDVTISNCLIAQGLDIAPMIEHHALGPLISGHYNTGDQGHRKISISFHHNYMAHFQYRFPQIAAADVDLYNNVSYNYDAATTAIDKESGSYPDANLNTRHNYYKQGPSIGYGNGCSDAPNKSIGFIWDYDGTNYAMTGTPAPIIHSSGNIGCASLGDTTGKFASGYWGNGWPWLASGWMSLSPLPFSSSYTPMITTMTSQYASTVVANSGANRIARSGIPETWYDDVDSQIIDDYTDGTGSWLTAPEEDRHYPDGWPTYADTIPATDSDSDGMSDAWEISVFENLNQTASEDYNSDGYTNIEEYVHYIGGYAGASSDTTPPATPSGLSII